MMNHPNIKINFDKLEEILDQSLPLEPGMILLTTDPDRICNYRILQANEFEPGVTVQAVVNTGYQVFKEKT